MPSPTPLPVPPPPTNTADPQRLVVRPWWDPTLAVRGHDPRSPYAERFWLPVVGPSTLLLLRRLARGLEGHPGGFAVDLDETSRALGLGGGTGRNSPVRRTVDRACTFGLARRRDDGSLEVRTHLPDLSARQAARLPPSVRGSLADWQRDRAGAGTPGGHAPTQPPK